MVLLSVFFLYESDIYCNILADCKDYCFRIKKSKVKFSTSMDADISLISLFYVLTFNSVEGYMMETMFWTRELIASQRFLLYWYIALLEGIFFRYVPY